MDKGVSLASNTEGGDVGESVTQMCTGVRPCSLLTGMQNVNGVGVSSCWL